MVGQKNYKKKLLLWDHKIEFKYRLTWLKCWHLALFLSQIQFLFKSFGQSLGWFDDFHQILFLWKLDSEANIVPLMFTFVLCNPYAEVFDTSFAAGAVGIWAGLGEQLAHVDQHVVLVSNSSMIGRSIRCLKGTKKLIWDMVSHGLKLKAL